MHTLLLLWKLPLGHIIVLCTPSPLVKKIRKWLNEALLFFDAEHLVAAEAKFSESDSCQRADIIAFATEGAWAIGKVWVHASSDGILYIVCVTHI